MSVRETLSRWSKDWGVRLAAVAATVTGVIASNQDILVGLISLLPQGPSRLLVSLGLAIAVFGIPTVTQVLQDRLTDKADADD